MSHPQASLDGTIAPQYLDRCQRSDCSNAGEYCIVLHIWELTQPRMFRGKHNSTKLFPAVVACKDHAASLSEIGTHMLDISIASIVAHFQSLSLNDPDLGDILIDCVPKDMAIKLWSGENVDMH